MDYDLLTINSDINQELMREVLLIGDRQSAPRLVIVISTLGGSPFVAYRVMKHLGSLYKTIDIVVPDSAMSAGTTMCLGADTIYMNEGSSLGPLDLQISHPTDGGRISTLAVRESTYDVFGLTATVAKQLHEQAVNELKLGKVQAAKVAHETASSLLKPIISKIDPYRHQASVRATNIGLRYATLLLGLRMMKNDQNQAKATAKILAEDYDMHEYAITMNEAKYLLKLNVKNITELDVLTDIKSFMYNMTEGVMLTPIKNMPPRPLPAKAKEGKSDADTTEETKP